MSGREPTHQWPNGSLSSKKADMPLVAVALACRCWKFVPLMVVFTAEFDA
jgi:hypothetical protein